MSARRRSAESILVTKRSFGCWVTWRTSNLEENIVLFHEEREADKQ